ncbi:hypothetical protein Talka_00812 [Tepidimonas alkaliphilus]|uniref:Transposase, Mutator family n=1 Tax=Tepidimonas alkaliphilus TaxID=2588942 RepID=A0A554WA60_9BURK|nr:hypothetical protein Talka_00812 [Tepidimonas alkaliphilus]
MGPALADVVAAWQRAWSWVIPFFGFATEMRRILNNANAIESVQARRGYFPCDKAATKPIWLALHIITAEWRRSSRERKLAMNEFVIPCGDRFILAPR